MKKNLLHKYLFIFVSLFVIQVVNAQNYSDENDKLSLPFTPTTIVNGKFEANTTWYSISISNGKIWSAKEGEVNCYTNNGNMDDDNYFCFVGDNVNGFQIFNKAFGPSYVMYCASSTSHEALIPMSIENTKMPNTFKLSANEDGYNFYYPGVKTACINDLHGDGVLTLWTNEKAPSADGCRLYFDKVNLNQNVPFKTTTISNGKFDNSTHWYTMCIRGAKLMHVSEDYVSCYEASEIQPNAVWCFEEGEVGYRIYNYVTGTSMALSVASSDNETAVMMSELDKSKVNAFEFALSENCFGGYNFHCLDNEYACWNDFAAKGTVALWTDYNSPWDNGSNISFEEYDIRGITGGGDAGGDDDDNKEPELVPVTGSITYVYLKSGKVEAFPSEYIAERREDAKNLVFIDKKGNEYSYKLSDVDNVSEVAPTEFPTIDSFKFNNKFNQMLIVDAEGEIAEDGTISLSVGGIGKRLIPSFKVSAVNAEVYIGNKLQESKVTSQRYETPLTYTITYPGYMMLRELTDGTQEMYPFGRDYKVNVTYLCDNPTTEYGIPIINIKTNDGSVISSKEYYLEAKISIDGAGVFPSMEETPMQIKGRGNSSWSTVDPWWGSNPKNPYRIKFAEKQKVLGMKSGKNWNLIAHAQTGSMMTNPIGQRVAEMVECAGANHYIPVELYINGDYRGSYCITEKIGFSNNSINIDDETNAALLELDTYFTDDYKFKTTDCKLPVNIKDPDFSEGKTNLTQDDIERSFNRFVTAINSGEDVENYADPVYLARYLMVNDLVSNQEIMHPKSTYCYNENILDESSLYVFGPVWDLDWGFGYETVRSYYNSDAEKDFWTMSTMESKDFMYKLRYSGEEMNKQYYRVWTDFMNNHLQALLEYCDDYYAFISRSTDHDNSKWNRGNSKTYEASSKRAKTWLSKRANYVYDFLSNTLGYADKDYLEPDDPIDTSIAEIESNNKVREGIYDMQGRKMNSDFLSLPAGLYIVNGKKIMKR